MKRWPLLPCMAIFLTFFSCHDENDHAPNTFVFSTEVRAYNPTSRQIEPTTAHLRVTSGIEILYDMDLSDKINNVDVRDGFDTYEIAVTKGDFATYESSFSAADLKKFSSSNVLSVMLLTQSLDEGLVAYYPFNGNAHDVSGHQLNGIVQGAELTTDRHGFDDAAYDFNGLNAYIVVPHDDALNVDSDFTISLWAEISSSQPAEQGINDILRKWDGNAEGYPFAISYLNQLADDAKEDKILFARYDGQTCDHVLETLSTAITNDTFLHVALIRQSGKLRTYIDDELISEITDSASCSTSNAADMTIGCRGNLMRFFKGKIDDIRIYNRALTEAEIGQLAHY